jgi:hypothetical protein
MVDDSNARGGRLGGILVAVVIGGSLVGALGWYMVVNRHGIELDTHGFDVAQVTPEQRPTAVPGPGAAAHPQEGMLIKSDRGMSFGDAPGRNANSASHSAAAEGARDYREDAKRYEGTVRDYAVKMTRKYASVRQYGKDWMSYPDLRKLNDDYMRTHDPMAFMMGLSRSKNFGSLIRKYAADPGIRSFLIDGIKQAPGGLLSTAGDALRSDGAVKNLANTVGTAVGLPSTIMTVLNGGSVSSTQVMGEVMTNPALRGAMQGQAPPVNLQGQQ